jgi:hypothetical protein
LSVLNTKTLLVPLPITHWNKFTFMTAYFGIGNLILRWFITNIIITHGHSSVMRCHWKMTLENECGTANITVFNMFNRKSSFISPIGLSCLLCKLFLKLHMTLCLFLGFHTCKWQVWKLLNTISSLLFSVCREWGLSVTWICQLHEQTHAASKYKVRTISLYFSSSVIGFLSNITDWWVKDFTYGYCNVIADSTILQWNSIITCTWERITGSAANGSWKNCQVVCEHMHTAKMFAD